MLGPKTRLRPGLDLGAIELQRLGVGLAPGEAGLAQQLVPDAVGDLGVDLGQCLVGLVEVGPGQAVGPGRGAGCWPGTRDRRGPRRAGECLRYTSAIRSRSGRFTGGGWAGTTSGFREAGQRPHRTLGRPHWNR